MGTVDAATKDIIKHLGPLAALAGVWEGSKGDDTAPGDDRGTEKNLFRERMSLLPFGPTDNHEQRLYGLRYSTVAHRLGVAEPFHEETGYWLWDSKESQVIRAFLVPRGISVLAGGSVAPGATSFTVSAEVGSETYGICSNKFLDREFKTLRYLLKVTVHDANSFSYEEDTVLKLKGRADLFHHIDKNTLQRVAD